MASMEWLLRSQIIENNLRNECRVVLCCVDQASSPQHFLIPYPSLCRCPFPHLLSCCHSITIYWRCEDKGRGWGLMGTAQLISTAYVVKKCIPMSCNLAPYFSCAHNSFSARAIILNISLTLAVSFERCIQLVINRPCFLNIRPFPLFHDIPESSRIAVVYHENILIFPSLSLL